MSEYNLIVRDDAKNELEEAYIWYEMQQIDLGRKFILVVRTYMISLK